MKARKPRRREVSLLLIIQLINVWWSDSEKFFMKKYILKAIVYIRKRLEKILWMHLAKPIEFEGFIPVLKQECRDFCALVLGVIYLGLEKVQTKLDEVK